MKRKHCMFLLVISCLWLKGNLSRLREQIGMLESQKTTLQMQLEEQRFRPPVDGDRERSQLLLRIARLEVGELGHFQVVSVQILVFKEREFTVDE